jgi:hypothetical protein
MSPRSPGFDFKKLGNPFYVNPLLEKEFLDESI